MLYLHAIVHVISLCHYPSYCLCHRLYHISMPPSMLPSMRYIYTAIHAICPCHYTYHIFMPSLHATISLLYFYAVIFATVYATVHIISLYHCLSHRPCHHLYHISMPLSLCYGSMPYQFSLLLKADVMGIDWKLYTLHFLITYRSIQITSPGCLTCCRVTEIIKLAHSMCCRTNMLTKLARLDVQYLETHVNWYGVSLWKRQANSIRELRNISQSSVDLWFGLTSWYYWLQMTHAWSSML